MAVQDYKINYKSDFVLTINGDAGWATQFCIKFWTGMPSQAYFVGFDGVKYVNCRVGDTPTQLLVMFDDHHLPIGKLKMQIAYHTTIEEFPGSVFDEVTNARDVIVTIDGTDYQVMLDFTGEDAPELEFDLPAYANEAERIQNELQRQQNEANRIAAELQREQATAAAVQGAENVNAQLNGTTLTVTNRNGVSTSVNTKGEQGEQGPIGPEGPQGEQGISIVSFRPVYESGTVTYYSIIFSDGHDQSVAIPKGAKGDTGATGPTGPQGPQGDTGVSITGFVETGETETSTLYNITFSNGSTQQVAIPKGEKGDQGPVGPTGPQGPMGDVAVITPEQQAAFTMYSTTGQNTNGPMTQKAVTDAIGNVAASGVSYDNSQSGLAAENVQGALDNISEKTVIIGNPIVLSLYTTQNYYINNSGVWKRAKPLASKWLPVKAGIKYCLVGRYGRTCNYAFVKNNSHDVNHQADFADGTSRSQLISDRVVILTAPPDAKFLCVLVVGSDGLDSSPTNVSEVEYIDDVASQTSIQVWDDASRIGMTAIGEIPVLKGGYQGVKDNLLHYSVTRTTRLMVVLPTDSVAFIQPKGTYMMCTCLFQDSMPTDKFMVVNASLTNEFVDVQNCLEDAVGFTPNHIAINIAKGDNTEFIDIPPLSEMLNIVPLRSTSVRVFRLQQGYFSGTTGLYPTQTTFYKGLNGHYPRYIRFAGMIRITNTEDVGGRIYWYDKSQNFLGSDEYGTDNRLFTHPQAYYFRIGVRYNTNPPVDTLEIESYWDYVPFPQEIFEKIPSDEGYANLTFPVNILKPNVSNTLGVEEQYIRAVDFGVLHLPTDYTPYGSPTPLIIYLHGAAERYTNSSNRFGANVRYSPEWSAAGYAQMDVNMAPDCFPYTGSNLGTGDDVSCVYAAYQWVIEHYNIRRDGVYLFGRSRGAQAVMSILAQYNADKMPIVCALSNAGANSMILLALHRASTAQWWTAFCDSMGLPDSAHGRPAFGSGIVVSQPNLVTFLRNNIELWWKKSLTGFPTVIDNPTDYKTPLQIFNLMVDSYNESQDAGRAYLDFVQACTYRSPVPLRFDWCVGDTDQPWATHNYGWAGMKAFVDSYLTGDAIYRQWPSCTGGNPHYHEKFNLVSSYTLPNGVTVANASMAQIEWLLWAQSHDNRAITNYRG